MANTDHSHTDDAPSDPAAFWEQKYAGAGSVWSGHVNATLAAVVKDLEARFDRDARHDRAPRRALDLGCGEGGDAIWLAARGWVTTGVDISPTAVERGRAAAEAAGIPSDRIRFVAADLADWHPGDDNLFDLVTASFLQSPVEFPRADVLRRALTSVAPGGHLLIVSHAAPPPWAEALQGHEHVFPTPDEEVAVLELDPARYAVELAEVRRRDATGPDGQQAELDDAVVLVRRRD